MGKTLSLHRIATLVFLVGVFFIPFNSFQGFGILGEYDRDSCVLFFLLTFVLTVFSGKISVPFKNQFFQILILFLVWITLTVVFNAYDMSTYYFKKTSGLSRFLRQYLSFIISALILLITFYNVFKNHSLISIVLRIRKVILYSLIVVVVYASIEYLIVEFKVESLRDTLHLFDYFPFTFVSIDRWTFRISSVTFEPPALATYLLSIAGWMFSYILTEKGLKRFIPAGLVILFTFLSGSRAGFFIILIQAFVFVFYLLKNKKFNKLFVNIFLITFFSASILLVFLGRTTTEYIYDEFTSFNIDDDIHSNSNKTRFGMQYAMFHVFLENPVIGTGYGLQPFESKNKYPDWATKDNWEFRLKHLNEEHPSFPPGFNLYLRLLAETGIIGFAIFMLFLIGILLWCYNKSFKRQGDISIIALIITISMVGFIFNWLKMDTFRVYGFWLCLALIMTVNKQLIDAKQ